MPIRSRLTLVVVGNCANLRDLPVVTLALASVLLGFAHTNAERPAPAAKLARE